MDQITNLLNGFGDILTPENLVFVFVGALMGTAVGVLPGLGSAMAVALLLPLTASLDPLAALAMLSAIYFGGLFGDSIAGILMNTPGQASGRQCDKELSVQEERGQGPGLRHPHPSHHGCPLWPPPASRLTVLLLPSRLLLPPDLRRGSLETGWRR